MLHRTDCCQAAMEILSLAFLGKATSRQPACNWHRRMHCMCLWQLSSRPASSRLSAGHELWETLMIWPVEPQIAHRAVTRWMISFRLTLTYIYSADFRMRLRGIDSFGWYNNLRTIIHKSQPNSLITLTFGLITRPSSEETGTQFFRILMQRSTDWDQNVKVIKEFGCDLWIIVHKMRRRLLRWQDHIIMVRRTDCCRAAMETSSLAFTSRYPKSRRTANVFRWSSVALRCIHLTSARWPSVFTASCFKLGFEPELVLKTNFKSWCKSVLICLNLKLMLNIGFRLKLVWTVLLKLNSRSAVKQAAQIQV